MKNIQIKGTTVRQLFLFLRLQLNDHQWIIFKLHTEKYFLLQLRVFTCVSSAVDNNPISIGGE
jgi:hypothetical protein